MGEEARRSRRRATNCSWLSHEIQRIIRENSCPGTYREFLSNLSVSLSHVKIYPSCQVSEQWSTHAIPRHLLRLATPANTGRSSKHPPLPQKLATPANTCQLFSFAMSVQSIFCEYFIWCGYSFSSILCWYTLILCIVIEYGD